MLTASDLHQFTGTENWFRHWANKKMLYTDGVQYFAEHAGNGAHWFLDIVATELVKLSKAEPFIVIELESDGSKAEIRANDGDDRQIYSRKIDLTDCPLGVWKFYLEEGFVSESCTVLLLPSEH